MTPESISSLINLGAAAAVIIVVVYFLSFIERRDRDWQAFFQKLLENRETPLADLATAIHELLGEFRTHDTWEHTKLDEMSKQSQQAQYQRKTDQMKQDKPE